MPGVRVMTGAVAGPSGPARALSGQYFVTGLAERGPVTAPVKVQNLADYETAFGPRPSYGALYDDVRTFFEEGGSIAYVNRVVGPAATTGSLSAPLVDRATPTPVATLQVTATGPGAWSLGVTVQVSDGTVANTFTLTVRYAGEVVETYRNLRSPQDAVSKTGKSSWIRLTDLASATAAPGNNPAVVAATALAAGTDDRASVTSTHYVSALTRFDRTLGDGAVAIPGVGDAVHAGLSTHAKTYSRTALLSTARTADKEDLLALAASYDTENSGLFAPWVRVPDGSGGTRAISPEGYIAAVRARAHEQVGPWQAAAGNLARSTYISDVDVSFGVDDVNELNDGKVNIIVRTPGAVKNYGWRTLSEDVDNWRLLTGTDVVNRIVHEGENRLEGFVFGTIDAKGQMLGSIAGTLEGIVRPMADRDGLFPWIDTATGRQIDPGYKITVDNTNNPASSLAQNQVNAYLAVRVSPTGELIFFVVTKAGVLARV